MRRLLLPVIILIIGAAGLWYIQNNAPATKKGPPATAKSIDVETRIINTQPYTIKLTSFGQVSAIDTANISSQVDGRVTSISPQLQEGAFFSAGDLLLTIDNKDYQSAINSAKAKLTRAQQEVVLEQAQVTQAKADWKRLNPNKKAPALVSRTPQITMAKADVSAAYAEFNTAVLNFQRTKIVAPFDGRVLSKQVNIGDFVNANSALASVISTQALQVRLGLKNSDLPFIDLPEPGTAPSDEETVEVTANNDALNNVTFESTLFSSENTEPQTWQGKIVRTEATIDSASQQLFIIGEIAEPFSAANSDKHPLKIDQYVRANIQGKRIDDAIAIDIGNIYQGEFVMVVKEGLIHRQDIEILWQNDETALISKGLKPGDILITSVITEDAEGSPISTGEAKQAKKERKPRN